MDINQNQMFLGKFLFIIFFCFSLTVFSQGSGYSLAFEQVDSQYVASSPISPTFGTATNNFTVECFISLSSSNNSGGAVTSYSSVEGGWAVHISSQRKVSFILGKSSSQDSYNIITFSSPLPPGKWYHIAGVKRDSVIEMYVNGVSIGQEMIEHPFSITSDVIVGKRYTDLTVRYFDGQVDEVRIWDHALDVKEIRTWMCKKLTNSHPNYSKLVRYYNFNTGNGTTVIDHAAGDNNGTFFNSPTWKVSGAPIGDESTYQYSTNINTSLSNANGEGLTVNSVGPSIAGVHIYRVDEAPNHLSGLIPVLNNNKHFGVFKAGDNGNTASYDVTYNYFGNPEISSLNENKLALYKRADNSDLLWIEGGATLDIPLKTLAYTATGNNEFILGEKDFPLPIELISFDVSNQTNLDVQIEWTTASETNNDYFTIERSADGKNWREVHNIKGAGNSSNTLNYSSIDDNRLFGTSYYRLKQTDFDGATTYSQTKSISLENLNQSELDIYPNPFKNEFNVKGSKSTLEQVRIFSSTGRDVTGFTTLTTINDSFVRFDLSQLSSGLYFVITETTSNKIVKY